MDAVAACQPDIGNFCGERTRCSVEHPERCTDMADVVRSDCAGEENPCQPEHCIAEASGAQQPDQ